jgi:hypothetical protein
MQSDVGRPMIDGIGVTDDEQKHQAESDSAMSTG